MRLHDQELIAKVVLQSRDYDTAGDAAALLNDPTLLAKVAVEGVDSLARASAARRIGDQALLARIVLDDKDADVRRSAIEALSDEDVLVHAAIREKSDSRVGEAAVEKLKDHESYKKVAPRAALIEVRAAALRSVTDEACSPSSR